ncbi:MAG: efflux RND transporter permease subunit, partial [SAR324 cluster bacterium]|nr:efflux RND transporter permease subunit [SAR324 cluster bacterium]
MKNIIAFYSRNTVFANMLMVIIILSGIIASTRMIREFFPEFSLDMITITIVYPGANPEEVEEGISRKVESAVEAIEGVKQYTTQSMENISVTTIEVADSYNVDKVLDRVRSNVNGIATFPVNAEKPIITDLSTQEAVMIMGLSGDISERQLKEWAERMKDQIVALPQVSRVNIFGVRSYEISIEVSEKTLQAYGLTFSQLVNTIRRENLN